MSIKLSRIESTPKTLNKTAALRRGVGGDKAFYYSGLLQVFVVDKVVYAVAAPYRKDEVLADAALSHLKEKVFRKGFEVQEEKQVSDNKGEKIQLTKQVRFYWRLFADLSGFELHIDHQISMLHNLYKDARVSVAGIGQILSCSTNTARKLLRLAGVKLKKYKHRPLPPWIETFASTGRATNTSPPSPAPLPPVLPISIQILNVCAALENNPALRNLLIHALSDVLECDIFRAGAFLDGFAQLAQHQSFVQQLRVLSESQTLTKG